MRITEVRVKLMDDPHDRLLAFCSVTLDGCFVVRDLKLIQGKTTPFVAMPSRKLADRCPRCHNKNHLRAAYCNGCGARLGDERALKDDEGRAKLYADIAHPINAACRESIQSEVVVAYGREVELAKQPGYVCTYDDYGEERFAELDEFEDSGPAFERPGRTFRFDAAQTVGGTHDAAPARQPQTAHRSEDFGVGLS